jgi:tetratricopeptide (TPR) repeat protein
MDESQKSRYLRDIEYFSKKLEENPKSKVFMPLAMAYLKLEKYDETIEICTKGLDNNPDYIAAKTILAQAFLGKGMLNEAKGLLLEVATFSKDNHRANKLLGEIYRAEGNVEKAIYYYRTASMNSPEDLELRRLIEELAMTVDATPKGLDDITDEKPDTEEVSLKEETDEEPSDLTEVAEDLADEVIEDIKRGEEADIDIFEVEAQLEELINEGEYEKALEYVNEKLQFNPELLNKKVAEINAYLHKENVAQEEILVSEESLNEIEGLEEIGDLNLDVEPLDKIEDFTADKQLDFAEEKVVEEELGLEEGLVLNDLEPESKPESESESKSEDMTVRDTGSYSGYGDKSETEENFEDVKSEDATEDNLTESELDVDFDKKLEQLEPVNPNMEAIEKLENWLENISKVKEKRNV